MKIYKTTTVSTSIHLHHSDLEELLRKHLNMPNANLSMFRMNEYDDEQDPLVLSMTTIEKKEESK